VDLDLVRQLSISADTKIVLAVVDGLGGLEHPETGRSELEAAGTNNLDRLAQASSCGLSMPVGYGITPGSGPGHLALFGYDPLKYLVGRGVLEALGIDFDLQPQDVAARGNFCTLDEQGTIVDRRAGRLATEQNVAICEKLRQIELPDTLLFVEPVREHRFVLVLRPNGGGELSDKISETDPQKEGASPLPARSLDGAAAEKTAELVNAFVERSRAQINGGKPANGLTLRGFAKHPNMPSFPETFGLRAAAVAVYPMYRGLAKLVGMTVLQTGSTYDDEIASLRENWNDFDFFFIHYKYADSAGEDGNFEAKIAAIEAFDKAIPQLQELGADVLMVAGDHSTPATMAAHSWHTVPFLLHAKNARVDEVDSFNERACLRGALGTFPASEIMPLAMAHAGRFAKYGA
jgi:2,3-bisphosphoglycerate-independent phosphoglycerate mutase